MSTPRTLVALDIGSTKVCALIGELTDDDQVEIVGVGIVPSRGVKKGVVVNPEDVVESIEGAVNKAEQQSGFKIVSAFVGISGAHLATQTSQGVVAIRQAERQISPDDVQRALEAARVVTLPSDREIVHVLARHYRVDGEDGVKNPVGMLGHRMEVEATVVSGAMTSVNNLLRCVERAEIGIDSLVLQPFAAGEAVLTEAEKDMGVVLIDIGGGTTEISIFAEGGLVFARILPVGGFQITNDIAIGLRIPYAVAEDLKVRHGFAIAEFIEDDSLIELPGSSGEEDAVSRREIAEIIEPRLEETLELAREQVEDAGFDRPAAGVVLVGGSAQLAGIRRLAAEVFEAPVRIGTPGHMYGLAEQITNPSFAASVGLLRWGMDQDLDTGNDRRSIPFAGIGSTVSGWLRNFLP